jgi:hypothetical protein
MPELRQIGKKNRKYPHLAQIVGLIFSRDYAFCEEENLEEQPRRCDLYHTSV